MAEGYIGETTCSTYIRQRLHYTTSATSSGHNVTVELQMRRTNSYSGATFSYPSNSYITINGDRYDWGWTNSNYPSIPGNDTGWKTFASRTVHVSHTAAVTIGLAGGNYNMGSYLNGDTSGNITLEAIYTAPTLSSVVVNSKTYNSVNLTVKGSYGLGTGTKQIEGGVGAQNSWTSPSLRSQAVYDGRTTYTVTVNNSSTTTSTLSLIGNQKLWYGGYIYNGYTGGGSMKGTVYLPCPPLSALSLSSQAYSAYNTVSAKFAYTRQSDGGAETRTGYYRYSTDGGTTYTGWTSFGTVSNTSGTFTITLPTSKTVTVQTKLTTANGGDSGIKSVTITTKTTHTAPNFTNFTYQDTASAVTNLTGSNQIFIQGQSQPKVTISTANKATANDGATISGYTASLNAESIQIAYSSSAAVSGTFSAKRPTASGTLALTVQANDSLSLSTAVSKNVTVIPWAAPVLQVSAERLNNFENATTLKISGSYSQVKVNNVVKNTITVAYRYKKSVASSWEVNWTTRTITISGSNFSVADFTLNLDNEYQYDIEVRAVDVFATTTVAKTVAVGKPILFISKTKRVSINKKPTHTDADLDVNGLIYSQDQPVMTSHVGQIIMSTTLTSAAAVKAVYGGNWTSYSGFSVSGLYCWRRTS